MKKYRRLLVNLLIGLLIGTALMVANQKINAIRVWELSLYDKRFEMRGSRQPSSDVVLVAIDDPSIQAIASWPWPRATHGKLIERLKSYGAKVIAFDVSFESASGFIGEDDKLFAVAIRKAGNVVLISRFVGGSYGELGGGRVNTDVITLVQPQPELARHAGVGYATPMRDLDDRIRASNLLSSQTDEQGKTVSYDSMELAILRKFNPDLAKDLATRMADQPLYYINYAGPPKTYRTLSYQFVLNDILLEEGVTYKDIFNGKIAVIGATTPILHDVFNTPFASVKAKNLMPGVEIHAAALDTLLNNIPIRPVPPTTNNFVTVLVGLLTGLALSRSKPVRSLVITLALMVLFSGLNMWLFASQRIWLDLAAPVIVMALVFVGCAIYQFLTEERKSRFIKSTFQRYLSPKAVEELVKDPDNPPSTKSDRKFVTLLFSDVQGFTSISEKLPAEQVVNILNEYLEQMAEVVFDNDGFLDKYIGDGLMAWWGYRVPNDPKEEAFKAVKAGIEMQQRMEVLQKKWLAQGIIPLVIRIGINSGEAIIGNIGSHQKMDFTAIGDTVNLASRLEGQNKEFNTHMMISENTYQLVKDRVKVRYLAETHVKGKEEGVRVYELIGFADEPARPTPAPAEVK